MTIFHTVTAYFVGCNPHACLFGAFGIMTVALAISERRTHQHHQAQEHLTAGLIHIIIALLSL